MKNIAIFASGSGSNAENIANYFHDKPHIHVSLIVTNKSDAFVIKRASKLKIPVLIVTKSFFRQSEDFISILRSLNIDMIVLAGFLWLIPESLISAFPNRIINIHPALLPKYGGKGMYGNHIHEAVKMNDEKETGITIHYVNSNYDEGEIILQESCIIDEQDSVEDIADKIHTLEFHYFPITIEKLLQV